MLAFTEKSLSLPSLPINCLTESYLASLIDPIQSGILMSDENIQCCLCGKIIDNNPESDGLALSMDHVPPKQFYPKEIRQQQDLNLELAPSHKSCNQDFRQDEEYFYHSLYPLVANNNPAMGNVILQDFRRRSHKPQTPAMIRKIMKTASRETLGGIHLPPGIIGLDLDELRLQRIAIKIARGVLCLNDIAYMPESNCIDIRLCESESEVIELYRLLWTASPVCGPYPEVFSYKYFHYEDRYLINLLFWESFLYCLCFVDDPNSQTDFEISD